MWDSPAPLQIYPRYQVKTGETSPSPPLPKAWERRGGGKPLFGLGVVELPWKTLVLQVSALSRNDAAAKGWLLPRVRTADGAIAVTSLPAQEVGSAPGALDTSPS